MANSYNSEEKSSLDDSVKNSEDLKNIKLLMEASNKRRLQSYLEKQNISSPNKDNLMYSDHSDIGICNKIVSTEMNSNRVNGFESSSKSEVSIKEVSSLKNAGSLIQENTSSKRDFIELCNALDSSSSDCLQSNLDDLIINTSDYDDLLCDISIKKEESFSDSVEDETFMKFSTQLQHSDPKSMVFDDLSLWEKQKVPALQIGTGIPKPVLSAEEVGFSKHILRVLKEIKFFGPSCIQSVVWPSLDRGRSMVVVAPPRSGKTISYVLPLVSRFTARKISKDAVGPISIILCSSWVKAHAVGDYFHLFLDHFKMRVITLCTEGGIYKNKIQSLTNKCDVLITTPHCLFKFFEEKTICLARLEDFILDDGSNIMNKHKKELKEVLLHLMEARNRAECCPQLIICAERWNKNFQIIFDKVMPTPVMFFTSFLEAAIYSKVPISVHVFANIGEKKMALLGLLKNMGRVVICTTDVSDSLEVHHFLKRFHYKSYLVNEEMEHYLMDGVIKSWKADNSDISSLCLVITDQSLIKMCISNADCLVHYDIPSKSRLQFGNRFSCIGEHLNEQESSRKCVCHILLLESEYTFAPHLVEIIENNEAPPEKLLELCKRKNKDECVSEDLCHYMKAFGCCKKYNCKSRHSIDPVIDKPQVVPCEGDIHGVVTHIIDASHYYIRVMKYLDPVSNKTVFLNATYAEIGFQLRDFYIHALEEMKVKSPVIGESYVLKEENKLFFRIKVLEYFPETPTQLAQWKILYLDEGWIKYSNVLNIYKLADQIKLPEPLAVEVYLCNVKTPDSCLDWNPQTSQLVSDLIKGKEIHGKIVLCVGKTIWLNPLAVTVKCHNGIYVYPFKVNQKLFDYGHARMHNNHLPLLYKACVDKIPLPHMTKSKDNQENIFVEKPTVKYAFLDCDACEDVYVSSVVSPNQFYVQRAKFVECLDELLDKINTQFEKRVLKKAYTLYKGMHCIAPFEEDNRYYRAVITDILSYTEVQLFYVDFGDSGKVSRNNIYSLSEEFLLLPFQAIECEFAGIEAAHGGWTDSASNTLETLTRDEFGDMKIVQLKAYHKTSSYEGGNHYAIDLWDDKKKISEQLLQAGFGLPTDVTNIIIEPLTKVCENSPTQCNNEDFSLNDKFSSSEGELDPEDKEIAARFYGVLAKMMDEEFCPNSATIAEVSSDEEEILKEYKMSREKYNNLSKMAPPKLTKLKKDESSSGAISNSVKPLITWWDTPEELNILIMLKDIKIYQCDITDEGLNFSTIIAGVHYSTEEKFFEKIHAQEAIQYQTIQGISVTAKKLTPFKWPRFTEEKKRYFHIKYDLVHIDDSDNEELSKGTRKEQMLYPYEDKDGTSTDEEETYVEAWKDFAQTKDAFSQLT